MYQKDAGRNSDAYFPCASLAEALSHLRRPPAPAAVRFKIQNAVEEAAQVAAYVDARMVFDRLDQVCGKRWSADYEPLPDKLVPPPVDDHGQVIARPPLYVRCRLTLFGITRQDVGEGRDPKAAFSDAIKRAAVHFGVGRALYAMRVAWLREGDGDGELRRNRRGRLILDGRTEGYCRGQYERWLEARGAAMFGEPLDHGDERGASGFEVEAEKFAAEQPQAAVEQEVGVRSASEAKPGGGESTSEADSDSPPAAGEVVSGRLQAVSDGTPGEPPATARDRERIAHWQQAGSFKDETVAAIAELACGEKILERLTREQVKKVAWLLELAVGGRVKQSTLAGAVTRESRRYDLTEGAEKLECFLREKTDEVGLLGRREAA